MPALQKALPSLPGAASSHVLPSNLAVVMRPTDAAVARDGPSIAADNAHIECWPFRAVQIGVRQVIQGWDLGILGDDNVPPMKVHLARAS
jgi:hypothetical protein